MRETSTDAAATPASLETVVTLGVRSDNALETHQVRRGARLLEIAIEADTSLTFVCCRGVCGTCVIRVVKHEQNLSPRTPAEQRLLEALGAQENTRLACQCSVLGDVEIEPVNESELS